MSNQFYEQIDNINTDSYAEVVRGICCSTTIIYLSMSECMASGPKLSLEIAHRNVILQRAEKNIRFLENY